MNFECHIAFTDDVEMVTIEALGSIFGFHYSRIHNDEVYGPGAKQYLTKSFRDVEVMVEESSKLVEKLKTAKINPIRKKFEAIILDERYKL